jgi:hypothetical protein
VDENEDDDNDEYIAGLEQKDTRISLLSYVLTKFSRMRGQEFARTVRGQSSKYQSGRGNTTRVGVCVATAASKEAKSREKDMEARIRREYEEVRNTIRNLPNDATLEETIRKNN